MAWIFSAIIRAIRVPVVGALSCSTGGCLVGVFAFFRFDQFPQFDFAAFSPAERNVNRFFVRGSDAAETFGSENKRN